MDALHHFFAPGGPVICTAASRGGPASKNLPAKYANYREKDLKD